MKWTISQILQTFPLTGSPNKWKISRKFALKIFLLTYFASYQVRTLLVPQKSAYLSSFSSKYFRHYFYVWEGMTQVILTRYLEDNEGYKELVHVGSEQTSCAGIWGHENCRGKGVDISVQGWSLTDIKLAGDAVNIILLNKHWPVTRMMENVLLYYIVINGTVTQNKRGSSMLRLEKSLYCLIMRFFPGLKEMLFVLSWR